MISSVNITDIINSFRPLDVAAYLRLHGWKQGQIIPDKYSLWEKTSISNDEFEIMLPLKKDFKDIGQRINDLLEVLQIEERRNYLEIFEDFTNSNADIVRVRLAPESDTNGTLPLEKGALAFQQVRELILAAACSAVSPKKSFNKRKPDQAMHYLDEARIGQTKRGSYILTVISPVPPVLQSALIPEYDNEPFQRKVIRTLAEALNAVEEGVQIAASSGKMDVFSDAIVKGISANLCDAILGLHKGGTEKGVEFAVSWSPTRGTPKEIKNKIFLPPDSMPIIDEVASFFRQTSEEEDVEIIGMVKRLEHLDGDSGKVTVAGTLEGENHTVIIQLSGKEHELAIQAYQDRSVIHCRGDLLKTGKSYVLNNPRGLAILE